LRTFLTLNYVERYPVAFSQGFEAVPLNGREMNEHVWTSILLNEAIAFRVIKPFHRSFCHDLTPLPWSCQDAVVQAASTPKIKKIPLFLANYAEHFLCRYRLAQFTLLKNSTWIY
jgi:hypothetical protein